MPGAAEEDRVVVLVADDDEALVRLMTKGLSRHGFQVVPATSMAEALEKAGQDPSPDVLVADINLKDGWGSSLAMQVREMSPRVQVVYISGLADQDPLLRPGVEDHMTFLDKPFTIAELVAAIEARLDGSSPSEDPDAQE